MNQTNDSQQVTVKVARINSRAVIMAAIITAILAPIILYIFSVAFIHPSQPPGGDQVPPQSQLTIPEVAGGYSGMYRVTNNGLQASMSLSLQQNQQSLTGSCWIKGIEHNIYDGSVSTDGGIRFSIVITTSAGPETVTFIGARQSDGSLRGEWSGNIGTTYGENGTWSVSRG